MPKTRRLTGIAALSAVSLATVVVSAPVAAINLEVCVADCDGPGQFDKFLKYEAFNKVSDLYLKFTEFSKVGVAGLDVALLKIALPD